VASRTSISWQVTMVARMSPGLGSRFGTTFPVEGVVDMDAVDMVSFT
jgi:hypothetical protein